MRDRRVFLALMLSLSIDATAQVVRSASGTTAASVISARDQFRLDLGGGTSPGANGLFSDSTGARREINWDGVPDQFADPNNLPLNFFNVNSPRGVVFSTPGTGVRVSANAGVAPVEFGGIDPSYANTFTAFSAQRLFTPIGSNIVDVSFFLPGTTTPALTRGFGAIFSDVDLGNTTSISLFDATDLLGTFSVPALVGSETFSFLGISYAAPTISRVRITNGNTALAAGVTDQNGNTRDLVVMDDFLYGEPVSRVQVVPAPGTLWLVTAAMALLALRRGSNELAG